MKHLLLLLSFLLLAVAAAALAQDTNDYALRSDLAAYAERSDLAGYVTHASLSNYVTRSDLAAYLPRSDLAGYVTAADLAAYAPLSDLAAYATSSDLDDYATTDDLAGYATASDLAAAVASRLPATPQTSGSNTVWHVAGKTAFSTNLSVEGVFEADRAFFNNGVIFDGDAVFQDGLTVGSSTRTNWDEVQSLDVQDGESAHPTVDDGFVWTFPDEDNADVYLPAGPGATNRTRTIVVRHVDSGYGAATGIYGSPTATNILHCLTSTNPVAVFDWCPSAGAWLLR